MSNEASHGETKNAHGNTKSAHQEEEEEKMVDGRTQVLHAAMASGMGHIAFKRQYSDEEIYLLAWDLTQKLCGCLK
jgi:hypothetical protein